MKNQSQAMKSKKYKKYSVS